MRGHFRKAAAASLLLLAASASLPGAGLAAATLKTYTNTKAGYSIGYPAGWSRESGGLEDLFVGAPDGNAFVSANAGKSTLAPSQLKTAQQRAFLHFGTPQGKPAFAVRSLNGVAFQIGELVVKTSDGRLVDIIALDTLRGGYVYDFNGGVRLGTKSTDKETKLVQASLNSIHLK